MLFSKKQLRDSAPTLEIEFNELYNRIQGYIKKGLDSEGSLDYVSYELRRISSLIKNDPEDIDEVSEEERGHRIFLEILDNTQKIEQDLNLRQVGFAIPRGDYRLVDNQEHEKFLLETGWKSEGKMFGVKLMTPIKSKKVRMKDNVEMVKQIYTSIESSGVDFSKKTNNGKRGVNE
jgi:hypothetical protein